MSKIIAYGCSNTYGLELDGVTVADPPSGNCFASLIGAENRGIPAASNKQIMLAILKKTFDKSHKVVVQWTYPKSRTLLIDDKGKQHQLLANHNHNNAQMDFHTRRVFSAWQKFNVNRSEKDALLDEFVYVKTADLHIKSFGANVLHLHCDETWNKLDINHMPKHLYTPMDDATALLLKQDQCANGHPGPKAHQLTAKFIKRRLEKL